MATADRRRRGLVGTILGIVMVGAGAARVAGGHASVQDAAVDTIAVVMSGLDNPRGLAFGPEGGLYVAEAGRGPNDYSCFAQPEQPQCTCLLREGAPPYCSGPTGAVSRWWHGQQERVVSGLPSWATRSLRAEGPNGVSLLGPGEAFVTIGLEASPIPIAVMRDALGQDFGRLVQAELSGTWRFVADIAAYQDSPVTGTRLRHDSNPFGVLAEPARTVVVDSGGNALLGVAVNGDISTLAVLPPVPQANDGDAVPTSVAVGPDGAYYVGALTGFPFADGAANVYRVVPGEEPTVACGGFKTIIGIAFDADWNLYVLQHSTGAVLPPGDGAIYRVDAASLLNGDCNRANATHVSTGGIRLVQPTSIAIGPDGALYVSNNALSAGNGEVLRINP